MTPLSTDAPTAEWLKRPAKGFLTETELRQLDAVFGRILPPDHRRQIPGAVDVGAANFVSELLACDDAVYWEIPNWRKLYRDALAALDGYAGTTFQKPLADLDDQQMEQIIAGLEAASLAGFNPALDQKLLFATLRRHCIQGCFADPRWGGNKDKIMWRAIGYLQPPEDLYHE
jgi:hypothetical protein